jgi:hypothetical protein
MAACSPASTPVEQSNQFLPAKPSGERVDNQIFFSFLKSLILAQNERWRRGLGMQVERESLRTSTAA